MKRLTTMTILVAVMALLVAACGSSDDDGASLIEAGKLSICSEIPYEPFEFEDPAGPAGYSGFDIELVDAIAKELDLELVVNNTPFDGIWLQPAAGACDLVASAMTILPDRAENALFSDPYFNADQSLLVLADNFDLQLADTGGMKIGVQVGTTGEKYAEENAPSDAELVSYDEGAALFLAIEAGEVDAILQDLPVNGYRATKDDSFAISETFPTDEKYGFAASLDNTALIDDINAALQTLRDNGTYGDLHEKYFGTRGDE
jgi:polar amino acid transport system substrate-binding protein